MRRSKVFLTFDEARELQNELFNSAQNDVEQLFNHYLALRIGYSVARYDHSYALRLMHVSSFTAEELVDLGRNGETVEQILNYVRAYELHRARADA